ncbi:MAG: HAMP domain-containing histidine kinase [Halobacteriovoraceae bacterium]|nr:HAMP domain-containing histidine kinase [Halobacteriovoraceae bacterium]
MRETWNRLVEPPAFITDSIERMWANFVLGSMLVVLTAFTCIMAFIFSFHKPWVNGFDAQTIVVSICFLLIFANFFLAKTKYHYVSKHLNVLIYVIAWYCGLIFSRPVDIFIPLGFIPAHLVTFAIFWPFRTAVKYGGAFTLLTIVIIHFFVSWTPAPKPYYYLVALFFFIMIMSASYLLTLYIKAAYAQNAKIQHSETLREASDQMANFYNFSSLGAMTGEIMHEINNPLQVAFNCKDNLVEKLEDSNDEVKSLVRELGVAQEKIAATINNVSRYYRGTARGNFTNKTVRQIWENALYLVEHRVNKHTIPLYYQGLIDHFEIESLEFELSQVLVNLLNNAIDVIKEDPEGWIRVEFSKKDNNLLVRVINSGDALDEKTAQKFMTTFYTTKPPGEGSGMGLPICKRIIESRHHGEFGYEVFEDRTCFFFKVPLKQSQNPQPL